MLRRNLLLALIAALVAVAPSAATDQTRVKSYCSTTGDVCYGIFKAGSVYSFRLTLAAKYFQRYRICVRPLGAAGEVQELPGQEDRRRLGRNRVLAAQLPGPRPARLSRHLAPEGDAARPAAHVLPAGSGLSR